MPSIGNDLASIRKELDMSVEDVHQATKIPIHIIESIEDGSLFDEFEENTTYKRSYVRSYAKVLDLSERLVVRALDQVEKGTYSGLLREADSRDEEELLLEAEPEGEHDTVEPADAKDEEEDEDEPEKGLDKIPSKESKAVEEESSPPPGKAKGDTKDAGIDKSEDLDQQDDHAPSRQSKPSADRPSRPASETKELPTPPSVNSVDWADMGKRFSPLQRNSRMGVAVIVALIAVAGIAGFIYMQGYFSGSDGTGVNGNGNGTGIDTAPQTTTAIESDSLQLDLTTPSTGEATAAADQQRERRVTLADTLELVIYAAYDKLEPVRVYTDVIGSLNPYWLEQGDAYIFEFVNTARIRGQYSRMVLMLNGHVIQNFRQRFLDPESGMIELTRDIFEGDNKWLQPPPDSLDIDAPPPSQVQNRPIFN